MTFVKRLYTKHSTFCIVLARSYLKKQHKTTKNPKKTYQNYTFGSGQYSGIMECDLLSGILKYQYRNKKLEIEHHKSHYLRSMLNDTFNDPYRFRSKKSGRVNQIL